MNGKSSYPFSEFIRNVISVIAGVLLFFGLLFAMFPLLNAINEMRNSAAMVDTFSVSAALALLLLFSIGFASGLLAFFISTRKGVVHALIVGMVLSALYFIAIGKDVNWSRMPQESTAFIVVNISVPVLLLIAPWLGGWVGSKIKRSRKPYITSKK
jgi:uncharacterized membrane protein